MSTQVILTGKVEHLGDEGAAVKVADGYARNFLFPKGLALPASAANLKRVESLAKKRNAVHEAELAAAREIVTKLTKGTFTISVPAGADEKLFGSVTAADIAEALQKEGITIDRKKIVLEHAIRTCGHYDVDIKLHAEVAAKAKIWVVAAEGSVVPVVPVVENPKKSKKK
ncbi:MAG: 50S ribosomal protein L9 [Verrucomicrobiota bacterium]